MIRSPRCRATNCLGARPRRRDGLTFYEVFLALVLLAGSLAVLGQHVALGVRSSEESRLRTRAEESATSKLNEALAGVEPLETVAGAPLPGDDGLWSYSLTVNAGPRDGLLDLEVNVTHEGLDGSPDEAFALRQWIRDPAVLLDAEMAGGTP